MMLLFKHSKQPFNSCARNSVKCAISHHINLKCMSSQKNNITGTARTDLLNFQKKLMWKTSRRPWQSTNWKTFQLCFCRDCGKKWKNVQIVLKMAVQKCYWEENRTQIWMNELFISFWRIRLFSGPSKHFGEEITLLLLPQQATSQTVPQVPF